MWYNQQNPGISREIVLLFLGTTDFGIASWIFCRKFEPDRPKIPFRRKFCSRHISKSIFRKTKFEIYLFENLILRLVNFKTLYGSEFSADRVQIFGKRCRMVPKTTKTIFQLMIGFRHMHHNVMFYDTWRWIFKSTFIRAAGTMTKLCNFRKKKRIF